MLYLVLHLLTVVYSCIEEVTQIIESFVDTLAGQQANKGVFITASEFASTAVDSADAVTQKVMLIDDSRLADLMIEHDIGVSTLRMISLKRIDTDYFES